MDSDDFDTPQKTKLMTPLFTLLQPQKALKVVEGFEGGGVVSPGQSNRKPLHPRTPNGSQSIASTSCSSFHIFPNQVVNTPPAKRFHRVRNPFEAALAERLHLPLIASPSLFQRPTTPQLSSTQFEWTIEDVSSLKPAHLEPHETQFVDSPDPDYEAKAQSAISSYFKEQQIVPSPVDCPLRTHRIILSELNGNTPISKTGRRIRDFGTQTELSLPAVLPKALEDALRPYFQVHLAESFEESTPNAREQRYNNFATNSFSVSEFKDTSLRRKLFDMHNIIVLDSDNRANGGNAVVAPPPAAGPTQQTAIVGKLSDSLDKSSFGSLSPISATDCQSISPHSPRSAKRKSRLKNFLDFSETEALSPIHPPVRIAFASRKSLKNSINSEISAENYRSAVNASEQTFGDISQCGEPKTEGKFTPDRSSSPLRCLESAEFSTDSFNLKISRLMVNSCKSLAASSSSGSKSRKSLAEAELFLPNETDDLLEGDDEEMQVSQLSAQSSICSSTNSDTPRAKRRSASRKNLSQSFTNFNWLDDEEEEDTQSVTDLEQQPIQLPITTKAATESSTENNQISSNITNENGKAEQQRLLIYRTDSGFNEMTSSQTLPSDDQQSAEVSPLPETDESMICCSTPSKQSATVTY